MLLVLSLCVLFRFPKVYGVTFEGQGRHLQLEFADLASRRGGSVIAIATNESAMLLSWDSTSIAHKDDTLLTMVSRQKLRTLSRHLGLGATGISSDINYVSNLAFDLTSQHSFSFGSPAPAVRIAESLASEMHQRTLRRGSRPFGLRACLVGYSDTVGGQVLEIDPFGNCLNCKYSVIGKNADKIGKHLGPALERVDLKGFAMISTLELARLGAQAIADATNEVTEEDAKEQEENGREYLDTLKDEKRKIRKEDLTAEQVLVALDVAVVGKWRPFTILSPGQVLISETDPRPPK